MPLEIIRLAECPSTNAALAAMSQAKGGTVVVTDCQTAGRGQRGNSWEAEPGKNLTFSILLRPRLEASRQFELSMLVSLAIVDVLDGYLGKGRSRIKWPNDIYVGDGKICGILIENALSGIYLDRSIAGIGINVNQTLFTSDAPNPVSLTSFTGRKHALEPLLAEFCEAITDAVETYIAAPQPCLLKERYMAALYRFDGKPYPFIRPDGTVFQAAIEDVALDGMLRLSDGQSYAFKEVGYII